MANWQLWASFLLKIKIEWKQKLDGFLFNENITLIFIFHQMVGSPSKTMKNVFLFHLKSSFRFRDIQIFVFSSSPLFFPVSHRFRGWVKKNLKVYNVINCLNNNLITHFVWYLEKKIRCDIETLSIDGVLNTEHFYEKITQKICIKS